MLIGCRLFEWAKCFNLIYHSYFQHSPLSFTASTALVFGCYVWSVVILHPMISFLEFWALINKISAKYTFPSYVSYYPQKE